MQPIRVNKNINQMKENPESFKTNTVCSPNINIRAPRRAKVGRPKLPKCFKTEEDKELEKQIALKQLMEVNRRRRGPKENNNSTPNVNDPNVAYTPNIVNTSKVVGTSNVAAKPPPKKQVNSTKTSKVVVTKSPRNTKTSRNKYLVSTILNADDIAKEIIARAEKKVRKLPEGGDLIFQKQLTKRLAEKLVKEDTLNQSSVEMLTQPPKLLKLETDTPDVDGQMIQKLEESTESQYLEHKRKAGRPKVLKYFKTDEDKELEKQMALKQLMEVTQRRRGRKENNNNASKSESKPKKRLKNEVQRLLQDEGAVEKGGGAKATALPSTKLIKAQEVSQASLEASALKKGLRLRHPTKDSVEIKKETENQSSSDQSGFVVSSPTATNVIRRHSSSSSYSGNNSPVRRISLDQMKSDGEIDEEVIEYEVSLNVSTKSPKTYQRSSGQSKMQEKLKVKSAASKLALKTNVSESSNESKSIDLPDDQNGFKEKLQAEFTNKLKTMMVRQRILIKTENHRNINLVASTSSQDNQLLSESNKSLTCKAIWQML